MEIYQGKSKREVQLAVSDNILKYRKVLGISQVELSKQAQLPLGDILLLEDAMADISIITLNKLALVLNTTPKNLLIAN